MQESRGPRLPVSGFLRLMGGRSFHTLESTESGAPAHILAMDQDSADAAVKVADAHGARIETVSGNGEFLGTTRETGNADGQRADAHRVSRETVAQVAQLGKGEPPRQVLFATPRPGESGHAGRVAPKADAGHRDHHCRAAPEGKIGDQEHAPKDGGKGGAAKADQAGIIHAAMWPEEATRTSSKSCFYTATGTVDGVTYTARSRSGAAFELARTLIAAGIPDSELRVGQKGHKGDLIYRSFHAAAEWTIKEDASGLRRVRWEDPAVKRARLAATFREKQAGSNSDGVEAGSTAQSDKSPDLSPQDEAAS